MNRFNASYRYIRWCVKMKPIYLTYCVNAENRKRLVLSLYFWYIVTLKIEFKNSHTERIQEYNAYLQILKKYILFS